MNRIYFIGDMSQPDAQILAEYSSKYKSILEFGVGGSTQVIATHATNNTNFICVDTMKEWIATTKTNLTRLNNNGYTVTCNPSKWIMYENWSDKIDIKFGLIFNDGKVELRKEFGIEAWKYLKIGGKMIIHDTKVPRQMNSVMGIVKEYWLEVASIEIHPNNSNMTIITKKKRQPYYNWNKKEGKKKWEIGYGNPPKNLWNK